MGQGPSLGPGPGPNVYMGGGPNLDRVLAACHMHANTYLLTQRAMNAMCQKWCYWKVVWHERVLCNHRFVHYAYTLGLCQRHVAWYTRIPSVHDSKVCTTQAKLLSFSAMQAFQRYSELAQSLTQPTTKNRMGQTSSQDEVGIVHKNKSYGLLATLP